MQSISFESPYQGPIDVCLVKSVAVLFWYAMSSQIALSDF